MMSIMIIILDIKHVVKDGDGICYKDVPDKMSITEVLLLFTYSNRPSQIYAPSTYMYICKMLKTGNHVVFHVNVTNSIAFGCKRGLQRAAVRD